MNSNLISKNISGYFDELINKPIITSPPKQSTMSTFYKNYVEHNLLLIIIIIFIIIFLLFKYFTKNSIDDIEKDKEEKKTNKEKERERKFREKINKERELLEKEKSEILTIIDELSEINYKRVIPQNIQEKENSEDSRIYNNEDIRINNKNKMKYNSLPTDFEAYTNNENYSDDYYDIKENKSELIDGVYFEKPYN
jgi:uncharacterized membrane protein